MTDPFIYELLIVLTFGLIAGLVSQQLGAPTLVGYLIAGGILGAGAFNLVSPETHEIEYLAEAGVFFLLFSIGLEFSLDDLLSMGRQLIVGGTTQMLLCAIPIGVGLILSGIDWPTALLLASAVAFSSTVLVFKSLSEEGHAATPHGRRAIGILLFQDAALIPLLLFASLLLGKTPTVVDYLWLIAGTAFFLLVIGGLRSILSNWLVPHMASRRTPELVVLFSLVVLGVVTLIAHSLGLPPAVGAFAAGLCMGGNRWSGQFDALLLPFRETFAAVFFVSLGLLLNLTRVVNEPLVIFGGIALLLVLKTFAAAIALRLTGLPWIQATGIGVGLAHVGEFAYVLLLAVSHANLISDDASERFVAIGVGTLVISPLLMRAGLRWSRVTTDDEITSARSDSKNDSLTPLGKGMVIGLGPVGKAVASQLEIMGYELTLVDRSPINTYTMAQLGAHVLSGDATQEGLLLASGAEHFELIVVCVPDDPVALRIVEGIRRLNQQAKLIVRCRYAANIANLKRAGADVAVSEEATASIELLATINRLVSAKSPDK